MRIVLLLGSSCAGKTSLCRTLVEKHGWQLSSFDRTLCHIEDEEKAALAVFEDKLAHIMSPGDIHELASHCRLSISKGPRQCRNQRFNEASLPQLEKLLGQAGFAPTEIPNLAQQLRQIAKIGDDRSLRDKLQFSRLRKCLYEELLDHYDVKASIIIDMVPDPLGDPLKLMKQFDQHIQAFLANSPDRPITVYKVLAFCHPITLSERIQQRNYEAELQNILDNKREGLFPFQQLSQLVTVTDAGSAKKSKRDDLGNINYQELAALVEKHYQLEAHEKSLRKSDQAHSSVDRDSQDKLAKIYARETRQLAKILGLAQDQNTYRLIPRHELGFDFILINHPEQHSFQAKEFFDQLGHHTAYDGFKYKKWLITACIVLVSVGIVVGLMMENL